MYNFPAPNENFPIEQIEIPVRVIHVIKPEDIPTAEISFERHIRPLLSYYIRYFPWLHVTESGGKYSQFLNLEDYESFCEFVPMVISRISKEDSDREKMPRSRDFPIGGIEIIKRWKDSGMVK